MADSAVPTLQLVWKKDGRSFYARMGRLSLQVKPAPPETLADLRRGRRWKVGEVLGCHWLDPGAPRATYASMPEAAAHAERFAREALLQALPATVDLDQLQQALDDCDAVLAGLRNGGARNAVQAVRARIQARMEALRG